MSSPTVPLIGPGRTIFFATRTGSAVAYIEGLIIEVEEDRLLVGSPCEHIPEEGRSVTIDIPGASKPGTKVKVCLIYVKSSTVSELSGIPRSASVGRFPDPPKFKKLKKAVGEDTDGSLTGPDLKTEGDVWEKESVPESDLAVLRSEVAELKASSAQMNSFLRR